MSLANPGLRGASAQMRRCKTFLPFGGVSKQARSGRSAAIRAPLHLQLSASGLFPSAPARPVAVKEAGGRSSSSMRAFTFKCRLAVFIEWKTSGGKARFPPSA